MKCERFNLGVSITVIFLMKVSSVPDDEKLFDWLQGGKFSEERSKLSRNSKSGYNQDGPILDFIGLVNQFGYPGEEHRVITSDGYRLKIHRIPGSKVKPPAAGKPVVFFQHGLFQSSDAWVLLGGEKDLAYALADKGYDVWLGNARGNTYSRSHVRLSPDHDEEFWQFSFHEIALYDVTAAVDYILELTGQSSILYIGHSMGTTISYVLLSMKPEYNDKIWLVISLSPIAFWRGQHSPLVKFLQGFFVPFTKLSSSMKVFEILPLSPVTKKLATSSCSEQSVFRQFCQNLYAFVSGYNPYQLNSTLLPYVLSYFPAGASMRTMSHYMQNINSGDFTMYDYGEKQNLKLYGQSKAPAYNLKNVVAPVALIYGKGDSFVQEMDPLVLARELPNVVMIEAVADEYFGHLDFLFSINVKELISDRVLNLTSDFRHMKE